MAGDEGDVAIEDQEEASDEEDSNPVLLNESLRKDVAEAKRKFRNVEESIGILAVDIQDPRSSCIAQHCSVVLTFDLTELHDGQREFCGIADMAFLTIIVDLVDRSEFRQAQMDPLVLACRQRESPSTFLAGEQLKGYAKDFLRCHYRPREGECDVAAGGSLFAFLYGKLDERIRNLAEYCIACNGPLRHVGVMPTICDRDLCAYQFHKLDLFSKHIKHHKQQHLVSPDVLALLLHLCAAANDSTRRAHLLAPAPPNLWEGDLAKLHQECGKLARELGRIPSWGYDGSSEQEGMPLRTLMNTIWCPRQILRSPNAYIDFRCRFPIAAQFIEWLVMTNRTFLCQIPREAQLRDFPTPYQYICVADSPAKQERFEQLKKENHGNSAFLFHGSPLSNWHSIMRNGLKIMSNTNMMTSGAAHGPGIYLSPNFKMSYAYSYTHNPPNSIGGRACGIDCSAGKHHPLPYNCQRAIAIVEVIDQPTVLRKVNETISVLKDEDYCSIRLLLLFDSAIAEFDREITPNIERRIHLTVNAMKILSSSQSEQATEGLREYAQ